MEEMPTFYTKEQAEQEGQRITKELNSQHPDDGGVFTHDQYEAVNEEIQQKQRELIGDLAGEDPVAFLCGGYAADLLMHGEVRDPHTDVDMLVLKEKQGELKERLENLGLNIKGKVEPGQQEPYKLYVTGDRMMKADFGLVEVDVETGEPCVQFQLENGKAGKLYFDAGTLGEDNVFLDGKRVKVISPRGLIQSLLFYGQIGRAELREKDAIRVASLIQKYFPGETKESELFRVRVEEI